MANLYKIKILWADYSLPPHKRGEYRALWGFQRGHDALVEYAPTQYYRLLGRIIQEMILGAQTPPSSACKPFHKPLLLVTFVGIYSALLLHEKNPIGKHWGFDEPCGSCPDHPNHY
ncbi:hypothetical protein [Emticicia sp. 17c]|uniref:hypothetical protein n=1 Tax=Emticicia sp. 17c TaxID=3127704 RepID=UPI00301D4ED3